MLYFAETPILAFPIRERRYARGIAAGVPKGLFFRYFIFYVILRRTTLTDYLRTTLHYLTSFRSLDCRSLIVKSQDDKTKPFGKGVATLLRLYQPIPYKGTQELMFYSIKSVIIPFSTYKYSSFTAILSSVISRYFAFFFIAFS